MALFEIVYFTGCPLVTRARAALMNAGILDFEEINQDSLPKGHPLKGISSPSLLKDGHLFVGCRNNGQACTTVDWKAVTEDLKRIVNSKYSGLRN